MAADLNNSAARSAAVKRYDAQQQGATVSPAEVAVAPVPARGPQPVATAVVHPAEGWSANDGLPLDAARQAEIQALRARVRDAQINAAVARMSRPSYPAVVAVDGLSSGGVPLPASPYAAPSIGAGAVEELSSGFPWRALLLVALVAVMVAWGLQVWQRRQLDAEPGPASRRYEL